MALLTLARDSTAQRGGAVRSGGAERWLADSWAGSPERQLAKIGVVTGAARSVGQEAQARAQYQATAAYQSALRSDFNQAPPVVLGDAPSAATAPSVATAPPAAATAPSPEAVIRKNGKPVVGVTLPADWKPTTGATHVSGVSADGQAFAMIAILDGAADKQAGIAKVKQGLLRYLQEIKYDDQTETNGAPPW